MIRTQQSPQHPNCNFKQIHISINFKFQMLLNPLSSFIEFILQIHDVKSIQGIDNCQSKGEPIVVSFGNRFEIVVSPRELFVTFPGVFECFNCSTLSLICRSL